MNLARSTGAVIAFLLALFALLIGVSATMPSVGGVTFVCSVLLPTLAMPMIIILLVLLAVSLSVQFVATTIIAILALPFPLVSIGGQLVGAHRAGVALNLASAAVPGSMKAPHQTIHGMDVYGKTDGSRPIIFNVHGGGWKEDAQMQATLQKLANAGWVVVRPSYPLSTPTDHTYESAPQAVRKAYETVARHPQDFGGDTTRISMFGDSAGGGLGINLAYQLAADPQDLPVPKAVVALYPTVNLEAVEGVKALAAGQAVDQFIGGGPYEYPERYKNLNSATWITPQAPPTLIIQGSADTFVPPPSVRNFVKQAPRAEYVSVPYANHAFDSQASRSPGFQIVTKATVNYLRDHA